MFTTIIIKGQEYKLKLRTVDVVQLEKGKPFIGKIGNIVVNLLARNNTSSQFLS